MAVTKIIPEEAPELVSFIIKGIINAIKAPNAEYLVEPGLEFVKEICGTQNGHEFVFSHIPKTKRGERDKIYALYDDLEFTCDFNVLTSEFFTIDSIINKKYVYDMNTGSYVLRPNTTSAVDFMLKWFRGMSR